MYFDTDGLISNIGTISATNNVNIDTRRLLSAGSNITSYINKLLAPKDSDAVPLYKHEFTNKYIHANVR